MIKKNNGFISLIKFILSILIVLYHSWQWNGTFGNGYFNYGYLATKIYFIIFGFLMINSYYKNKEDNKISLGVSTVKFIKNRFYRFIPYMILSFIIGLIIIYGFQINTIKEILKNNFFISELFLISGTGSGIIMNTSWWFLSVLLIVYLICYPLLKKYKETYIYIYSPLFIIISLCIINYFKINIDDPNACTFLLINGFWQGLIYFNLGVISYSYLEKNIDKLNNKILITILELILWVIIFVNMYNHFLGEYLNAVIAVVAISLSFSNKSYTSEVFDNKIVKYLEKFGFVIYINNCMVRQYITNNYNLSYNKMVLLYMILTIGISMGMFILIEYIYPKIINKRRENKNGNKKRLYKRNMEK